MSKWCLVIVVGCLCLWSSGIGAAERTGARSEAPAPSAAQDVPSIKIPEAAFDFGEVLEGGEVVHEFGVKNSGRAALQIDQVRPG